VESSAHRTSKLGGHFVASFACYLIIGTNEIISEALGCKKYMRNVWVF